MTTSSMRGSGFLSDLRGLTRLTETNAYADPQAVFRRLRAEWGEVAPVELDTGIHAWLVMGYNELVYVLRHERQFAKNAKHWRDYAEGRIKPDFALAPLMCHRPNAFHTDGEEHSRLREPLEAAVNGLRLRQTSRQVRETCSALIDEFAGKGCADLVADYARMVPTMALGRMFGLSLELARDVHYALTDGFSMGERAQDGNARLTKILAELVQRRRAEPADDMTTAVIQHENLRDDGERLHQMALMLAAAAECTMGWIGSSLQLLLTDPRFSGRMRGGRLGIDDALDEVLWREPPMTNLPARYPLSDTELAGQPIQKGDALILGFAAANADPRVHTEDEWSEIGNRAHLAWSTGAHACPAPVPARIIVRTAVEAILYQLPGVHLTVPTEDLGRLQSPWTRCPATLPVEFAARSRTADA